MKTFGNFFERMKELIPSQQSTSARTTPNSRYQGEPATTLSDRPSNATDEEEHFRLALRISAAEAQGAFQESSRYPTLPPVPIREPQAHDRNAKPAPVNDTASDELLARHLQDQLNLEQDQANLGASGASSSSQRPQNPNPFSPPLPKPSQSSDHPPSMASNGAYPDSGSVIAPGPPPRDPPLWAGFRSQLSTAINAALAPALPSANTCAGCGKAVQPWHGSYVVAAGKTWHTWCLKCAHCQQPIQRNGQAQYATGEDGRQFHMGCHKTAFHPRCDVCAAFVAADPSGVIRFHRAPFWGLRYCPGHETDGTPRCLACNCLQLQGEQWVQMDDARFTCLRCLSSLVRNTDDAQPLYDDVLRFYTSMSMPLPVRPPLMLVESGALNEAEGRERGHKHDGPVFHTRGLTLSEEHRSIRTVASSRTERGGMLSVIPKLTRVTSSHCEVTAILVLFGLPWLLTGSILAHEAMHAWLRLSGMTQLCPEVEEGLAQLMALLWLEHQSPTPGSYEERLACFLAQQIREDITPVYGDGFRAAHAALQLKGLPAVLAQVRRTGQLM